MTSLDNGHEHEFEPEFGLPEPLPKAERMIWQSSPNVRETAIHMFHMRKLVLYFIALGGVRVAYLSASGMTWDAALISMLLPGGVALIALAATFTLAWLTATTTVYTLTDQRIVMRIGIVLTLTYNFPLRLIESAGLKVGTTGFGDIPIALKGDTRIAWVHLWPHTRAWQLAKPEPMMRCVPDVQRKAQQLLQAWSNATGVVAAATADKKTGVHLVHWKPNLT